MFNVQGSEVVIILLLALIVLGPEKLPDAIRRFTKFYGEFKKMSTGFQSELRNAIDEPMKELRDTADLVRRSADLRDLTGSDTGATKQAPAAAPANDQAAQQPSATVSTSVALPDEPVVVEPVAVEPVAVEPSASSPPEPFAPPTGPVAHQAPPAPATATADTGDHQEPASA